MTHSNRDRIQRMLSLPKKPAVIWAEIGGFGDIASWHPMIESTEVVSIDGDTHRHLTLSDGAVLLERLIETGPHHYTYELVDGPLPLADHRATLSCVAEGDGCHVFWSAIFEPTDPSADDIVTGFYEEGLRALRKRYAT